MEIETFRMEAEILNGSVMGLGWKCKFRVELGLKDV